MAIFLTKIKKTIRINIFNFDGNETKIRKLL